MRARGSGTYTVALATAPSGLVTITATSDDAAVEINTDATPLTRTLAYSATDWNLEYICRKINRQSAYRCFIRAAPGCGDVVSGGCRSSPCDNGPLMGFDPAAGTLQAPLSAGVRRRLPFEAVRTLHPSAGSRHRTLNEPRGEAGKGLEPAEGSKGPKVWVRARVRCKVEARTFPTGAISNRDAPRRAPGLNRSAYRIHSSALSPPFGNIGLASGK